MDNTLKIGKYIRQFLVEDERYNEIIGQNKTFPIIATKPDTQCPFVTYQRTNARVFYTKDGRYNNTLSVQVTILCDNYTQSIDLLCIVRDILENKSYKDEDIWIRSIKVSEVSEDFNEDVFIQQITFEIDAI